MRSAFCIIVLVVLLGVAVSWSNFTTRHYIFRAMSELGLMLTSYSPPVSSSDEDAAKYQYDLYAHRAGVRQGQFDNSAPALEAARGGIPNIEIDIAFSSDDVPYLSHGDDLDSRSGTTKGILGDYAAAELDQLVLLDGSRLLRLERFFERYAGSFSKVVLDVKTDHRNASERARMLSRMITVEVSNRITVISHSGPLLLWLQSFRPELSLGCESYLPVATWLAGFNIYSSSISQVNHRRDEVARFFSQQRLYWTAKNRDELQEILAWQPEGAIVSLASLDPTESLEFWNSK